MLCPTIATWSSRGPPRCPGSPSRSRRCRCPGARDDDRVLRWRSRATIVMKPAGEPLNPWTSTDGQGGRGRGRGDGDGGCESRDRGEREGGEDRAGTVPALPSAPSCPSYRLKITARVVAAQADVVGQGVPDLHAARRAGEDVEAQLRDLGVDLRVFVVAGTSWWWTESTEATPSNEPHPPIMWPVIDLVALMAISGVCVPNTVRDRLRSRAGPRRGRGPVRVDDVHLVGRHAVAVQRHLHRPCTPSPRLDRLDQVPGVGRRAVAHDLRVDAGAAGLARARGPRGSAMPPPSPRTKPSRVASNGRLIVSRPSPGQRRAHPAHVREPDVGHVADGRLDRTR